MGDAPAAEPAASPPTWTPFLFALAPSEGFDPSALLAELGGDARPLVTIVDCEAITKESKDADVQAGLKDAGGELKPELVAKALAAKLAEDKAAAIEAKVAAIAAAEAAAAEAKAKAEERDAKIAAGEEVEPEPEPEPAAEPAEGEGEEETFTDVPPPVERSADAYLLLKNFPKTPEDGAAMAAAGVGLDLLLTLEMDSFGLAWATTGAAPEPAPEGEEEIVPEALPPSPLTEALAPGIGAEDNGLMDTATLTVALEAAETWANVPAVSAAVCDVIYATAQKKVMYEDYHLTLGPTLAVPSEAPTCDMTHYRRLLDSAAPYAIGLPYILHCLVEQVVRAHISDDEAAGENAEAELGSIEAFLDSSATVVAAAPKSSAQLANEATARAAGAASLVAWGDRADGRLHAPPPFGVAASGEPAKQHGAERRVLELLPNFGTGPEPPTLTPEERGAERTQLHHFSRFSAPHVDAAMQLRALAATINAYDVHRGGNGGGWTLSDRPWLEEHTRERMVQLLLEASATSSPARVLTTYHARDDVMLLAMHRAVPGEREEAAMWSCPLADRASRKFGKWHDWLLRKAGASGQPAHVPHPPIPPSTYDVNEGRTTGATLYKFDETTADILRTSQYLYPSDHSLIQITPSDGTCGFTCATHFRDGGFCAMRKADADESCSFAMTFEDGARASISPPAAEGSHYSLGFGGADAMQVELSCDGHALLTPQRAGPVDDAPAPTPAATLLLSSLAASGIPAIADRPEGGDVYIRAVLEGVDGEIAVTSSAVAVESAEQSYTFEGVPLAIALPTGSARPPSVRIELWDSDYLTGETTPLAAAVLGPDALNGKAGVVDGLALTAEAGGEMAFTCKYAVELVPSRKPAPPSPEVCRQVTPSGVVIVRYADGSLKALLRDGNLLERSANASEPLANAWVSTNAAGLRMGVTDAGEHFYVSAVAVASSTDPVTHHVVTTRADGTLVISRADGSRLVTFSDGTTIDSSVEAVKSSERGKVKVAAEGYPPLGIDLRLKEIEISGLDGTILKAEMSREGADAGVKLHHLDGTVLKLSADGMVDLYPAPLAWQPNRAADERSGIYHLDLGNGKLTVRDPAGSTFVASKDAPHHSIELVLKDDLAGELEAQAQADAPNGGADAPTDEDNPDWSHPPRLFVCRRDGTGVELLRASDVRGFMAQREAEVENGTAMLLREPLPAEPAAETYTFVWKDWMQMHIASLVAEADASDAQQLLGFMPKIITPPPETTTLYCRRLVRRDVLSEYERDQLEQEVADMARYHSGEEERAKAMHVVDPRTEEEKAAEEAVQQEMLKSMAAPKHLSAEIKATVLEQQLYASTAFLAADEARSHEDDRRAGLAADKAKLEAEAAAAAAEAAKVRKDPNSASFHGGFERKMKSEVVPVGGELIFSDSAIASFLGPAPAYFKPPVPTTPAIDPTLPVATGDGGFNAPDEDAPPPSAADEEASKLLASPFETSRAGGMTSVPPLSKPPAATASKLAAPFAVEPPALPPPAQRLSTRMPPRVTDGGVRSVKPTAPIVSEPPAQATPNLLNLLLEVPYKRGVHTVSVNQRYLNHEPTFDSAFELLPAAAHFGVLRTPCLYRFKLILTNVSNLPQRFNIKNGQHFRIVAQQGVVASGLSSALEVELQASSPGEISENLTIVTEREEILLPVSATVLDEPSHDAEGRPAPAAGARMLAMAPRDAKLGQTVPLMPGDLGAGTKRFTAPFRDKDAPLPVRPDIDDEDVSDDDEPPAAIA